MDPAFYIWSISNGKLLNEVSNSWLPVAWFVLFARVFKIILFAYEVSMSENI